MATHGVDPATAADAAADAALGLGGEAGTAQVDGPATAADAAAAIGLGGEAKISVQAILAAVRLNKAQDFVEEFAGEALDKNSINKIFSGVKDATDNAVADHDAGADVGLNGKEQQLLKALSSALKSGSIGSKSSLGNKFRSECDTAGMKAKEVKDYRIKWAENLHKTLHEKKEHLKSWKRTDTTRFVYRPLGALIIHLGGWNDPDAVQGGCVAALQCTLMGHPYLKIHPQTKMVNYAVAELEWKETFEESWSQASKYYAGDAVPSLGCDAVTGGNGGTTCKALNKRTNEAAVPPTPTKVTKRNASSAGSDPGASSASGQPSPRAAGNKEGGKVPGSGGGKPGDALQTLFRTAAKTKTDLQTATAKAEEILREINKPRMTSKDKDNKQQGGRDSWSWAKDNQQGDKLISRQLDTIRAQINEFGTSFILADVKTQVTDVKKQYESSRLVVELTTFNQLAPAVKKLSDICKGFVQMSTVMHHMDAGSAED